MSVVRRRVLALIGLAGLTGAASFFIRGRTSAGVARIVEDQFGAGIADSQAARAFIADYSREMTRLGRNPAPVDIVRAFLQSTSFVDHLETGVPFEYGGLFDPYAAPCTNRLAANWAPDDEHG